MQTVASAPTLGEHSKQVSQPHRRQIVSVCMYIQLVSLGLVGAVKTVAT